MNDNAFGHLESMLMLFLILILFYTAPYFKSTK